MRAQITTLLAFVACGADPSAPAAQDSTGGSTTEPVTVDGTTTDPGACEPTTEAIHALVIEPSCTMPACHGSVQPSAGLELTSIDALETALVGVPSACDGSPLVTPGDRSTSLLYMKLAGVQPCGDAMPISGPLSPDLVECVGAWIDGLSTSCEQCGTPMCVDVVSDPLHCGECDAPCPRGATCAAGACVCADGRAACGPECVDLDSDPQHCGGCDSPCDLVCLAGACASDCGDLTACDGACVDTTTNAAHCGGCGEVCGQGQACNAGACVCAGDPVAFSGVVGPLLVAECASAGCHTAPVPKAGLDLRATAAYAELVGMPASQCGERLLVVPGDADASYLIHKLRGIDMCSGSQMPKAGQALAAGDLAAIESWICNGALDD